MIDWRKTIAMVEKYLLPAFLFCFEFIFLVVYGLLVRYDEAGSPDVELAKAKEFATAGDSGDFVRELESSLSTTKTYPCEQCSLQQWSIGVDWMGLGLDKAPEAVF